MASLCLRVGCAIVLVCFSPAPSLAATTSSAAKHTQSHATASADKAPTKETDDTEDKEAGTPPSKPSVTEAFTYTLASGGAARVAILLQNLSIAGVGQVVATNDKNLVFLLDRQALIQSLAKKVTDHGDAAITGLQTRLKSIANALAVPSVTHSAIVGLPDGAKSDDFANAALKIAGITNATPIGDPYLLITYDPAVPSAVDFVNNLEQPKPPDKHVESGAQRLYYLSGSEAGTAVATVINNMYPDVAAAFLAPDMISLSMRDLPKGLPRYQTDTLDDARRAIARIDQPRPRASLDVWAIQIAGEEPEALEQVTPKIEELTSAYNEAMSDSMLAGWSYLTRNADFDERLRRYISEVSIAKDDQCCYTGDTREAAFDSGSVGYGLGYQTMLDPVTPNLIDMLVNIVAQKKPRQTAIDVINSMEGPLAQGDIPTPTTCQDSCDVRAMTILKDTSRADALWCRQRDVEIYRAWVARTRDNNKCAAGCGKDKIGMVVPPRLVLSCVRRELVDHLFAAPTAGDRTPKTSALGQMRAAVADFLYQYKLMARYQNDFHAYLEPMSADTLDVALLPIIDAFYDDLGAFQEAMEDQVYQLLRAKKISYSASGLVSMKMIAGTQGTVNSTSQNSFQMLQASSAADVSDAIASIRSDPTGAASKLIKLMTPTPVTATLGKELNLTSTIHSLSGAYGMELDLLIDSAENGTSQLVKDGTTTTKSDDLNSRVTTHHLQTKIRVDNLKLFEVSTARSLVARGQAPWVPVDPYFEIPVLSQIVKRPRKPKGVYTQSLLFVNALVVPTAIDLAYGNPITADAYQVGQKSAVRTMREAFDLKKLSKDNPASAIENYHAQLIRCLSSQYIGADEQVAGCLVPPVWKTTLQTLPNDSSEGDAPVASPN